MRHQYQGSVRFRGRSPARLAGFCQVSRQPTRCSISSWAIRHYLLWFSRILARDLTQPEQEKQLKYASLVANAIMLSNVANLSEVLSSMAADGLPVTPELAASISP